MRGAGVVECDAGAGTRAASGRVLWSDVRTLALPLKICFFSKYEHTDPDTQIPKSTSPFWVLMDLSPGSKANKPLLIYIWSNRYTWVNIISTPSYKLEDVLTFLIPRFCYYALMHVEKTIYLEKQNHLIIWKEESIRASALCLDPIVQGLCPQIKLCNHCFKSSNDTRITSPSTTWQCNRTSLQCSSYSVLGLLWIVAPASRPGSSAVLFCCFFLSSRSC